MVMGKRWTNKKRRLIDRNLWREMVMGGLKCTDVMKTTKIVNMWNMKLCSVLRGQESLCGLSVASCSPTSLSKATLCRRESSEPNEQTFFMTSHCSDQLHFLLAFFFFFPTKSYMLESKLIILCLSMIHIPFKQTDWWPPCFSLLHSIFI